MQVCAPAAMRPKPGGGICGKPRMCYVPRMERTLITLKGSHFRTERLPDSEVRISWSEDGVKWDALDFWTVPASEVDQTIAKLKEGVTI